MTNGFRIRNQSNISASSLKCFVSKWTNDKGSEAWFPLAPNFSDASTSFWARNGWEVIVFKDEATGKRRGWYLECGNRVVEVTFVGFEQELGLVRL